jgi:putative transferase (TIGR04331 family)
MKANFLVSAHPQARISGARRLFVTDPYVTHILEKDGELPRYEEVGTAPAIRTTREAFLRDHEFVDRKFHQYVPIVSQRLSEVHGTRYDPKFWRKALSLALLRHITLCYDLFRYCETYLHPEQHDCHVLSERAHFIPRDFNEHRRFFEHSDFGQEQLFSIYCRLFHPGRFEEWDAQHEWPPGPSPRHTPGPGLGHWLALLPRRVARRQRRSTKWQR